MIKNTNLSHYIMSILINLVALNMDRTLKCRKSIDLHNNYQFLHFDDYFFMEFKQGELLQVCTAKSSILYGY